jgi:glycosyltransferase involved in cell wall biosynthesis
MSILFGHPTGNPNSHHAALAHFEAGRLEAFCVPWFPSKAALACLRSFPLTRAMAMRLERRRFEPLAKAPKVQGRTEEFRRLVTRVIGKSDERLSYQANDWLMRTMARESRKSEVTAVHSYEDCSLWQFEEAKRLGKACIYDMPIGYYPAWQQTELNLMKRFTDWLPAHGLRSHRFARPEQKRREMELADLVLVPSSFVQKTINRHVEKRCALAPYGTDTDFWKPSDNVRASAELRFLFAGQISIRKGIPVLLQAWKQASLRDAELHLVGRWLLADRMRDQLPANVRHSEACSRQELLDHYQSADVFLFPSFFEGFALVLLEAMACGLPLLASDATGAPDIIEVDNGKVLPAGNIEVWTEALRELSAKRDNVPQMKKAAREKALQCTWHMYRTAVSDAVASFC